MAERCNVDLSNKGYHLPRFPVPEGHTAETYLRELCEDGLHAALWRTCHAIAAVRERLEYELGIIHQMGFDAYFLIVWDLCREASRRGIWYNARGSAAGSMVAYTLDITLIEPLHHGLIFERFLNPGRISMPDIDLDFQDDRRSELMQYTAEKYGADRVAQIITFGTLGARGAIRDVGRVMDIPLSEVDRVTKLIPQIPGNPVTHQGSAGAGARVQRNLRQDRIPARTDRHRRATWKAWCATPAPTPPGWSSPTIPLINYAPLHRPTSGSEDTPIKTVTQFEMSIVEVTGPAQGGLPRPGHADHHAARLRPDRRAPQGICMNLDNIPVDDPETFDLSQRRATRRASSSWKAQG